KLARLAANVLLLNRIEAQRVELQRQRVGARMLVRRAIETFERAGELARLRVSTSYPDESIDVDADPERAIHAIATVVAHALRFRARCRDPTSGPPGEHDRHGPKRRERLRAHMPALAGRPFVRAPLVIELA